MYQNLKNFSLVYIYFLDMLYRYYFHDQTKQSYFHFAKLKYSWLLNTTGVRGTDRHTVKNPCYNLQSALCTHSSLYTDSINSGSCSTVVHTQKSPPLISVITSTKKRPGSVVFERVFFRESDFWWLWTSVGWETCRMEEPLGNTSVTSFVVGFLKNKCSSLNSK